jgi:hypothetical protein
MTGPSARFTGVGKTATRPKPDKTHPGPQAKVSRERMVVRPSVSLATIVANSTMLAIPTTATVSQGAWPPPLSYDFATSRSSTHSHANEHLVLARSGQAGNWFDLFHLTPSLCSAGPMSSPLSARAHPTAFKSISTCAGPSSIPS